MLAAHQFCRIFLFQMYGFLERSKYYAIWILTEVGPEYH
jgi:hypothetical protein